jgi:putative chitinase
VENLSYSADRIRQIGSASPAGSRWRSLVRARRAGWKSRAHGNAIYCNRMGNGDEASGEGFLYRGRGLQTTGKTNYMALMMALASTAQCTQNCWRRRRSRARCRVLLARQ